MHIHFITHRFDSNSGGDGLTTYHLALGLASCDEVCLKCLGGKCLPPISERCKNNISLLSTATVTQMMMWSFWKGFLAIDCSHYESEFIYNLLVKNSII